eukprot:5196008-Karenia_brevis.AAC.1
MAVQPHTQECRSRFENILKEEAKVKNQKARMKEFEERAKRKKEQKETKKEKEKEEKKEEEKGPWVGEESRDSGGSSSSGSKRKEEEVPKVNEEEGEKGAKRVRVRQEAEPTEEDKAFQEEMFGP